MQVFTISYQRPLKYALIVAIASCLGSSAMAEEAVRVHVTSAQIEDVEVNPTLTGIVSARVQTDVSFEIGGKVSERLVETGDHVKKGQVLARLDAPEQALSVASAQASLDAAKAEAAEAKATLARQQHLFSTGVVSKSTLESAQQDAASDEADVRAAEAELASAKEQQSYAELKADTDGIIVDHAIEPGQVVAAGQTVFVLAEDGPRDAQFNVFEAALLDVDENAPIQLWLIADPKITATGKVREISPIIDADTGVITVKVDIEDTPAQMSLGAAVGGTMQVAEEQAYVVPKAALTSDGGKEAVWVVGDDNRVAIRDVTISRYTETSLVISDGLEAGDKIVTDGAQSMQPGQTVEVVEEAAQ